MNYSVWANWAAQGSKDKNQFDFFLATFEDVFFQRFMGKIKFKTV